MMVPPFRILMLRVRLSSISMYFCEALDVFKSIVTGASKGFFEAAKRSNPAG